MIRLFQRPILPGWIYPCTLEEIKTKLETVPPNDLENLYAIGLQASTKKDNSANGRYVYDDKPTIYLYSFQDDYQYRLPACTKRKDLLRSFEVEQKYGMIILWNNSKFTLKWTPDQLGNFILNHVLLHEIGHHVYFENRMKQGFKGKVNRASEQFAEHYARVNSKN